MKIMEEDAVDGCEMSPKGDCDFATYMDEEEDSSPDYFVGNYGDDSALPSKKVTEKKKGSNSVEALVRHFKIFFPKINRTKTSSQWQPEQQQSGLRSFSFSDSKIGKDFDNFTMGHALEIFSFDTKYLDEYPKIETAPPLQGNKRSRILGMESIFNNADSTNRQDEDFETPEEGFPIFPPNDHQQHNDYLFSSDSTHPQIEYVDRYQNFSEINEERPYVPETHEDDVHDFTKFNSDKEPSLSAHSFDGGHGTSGAFDEETTYGSHEQNHVIDSRESNMEDPYSTESCYSLQRNLGSSQPNSVIQEDFDDPPRSSKHKSMPSLVDKPPELPPMDPNRPKLRDEEIKVYRSIDERGSSMTLKRKSSNVFAKALRRISSYFSLMRDVSWKIDRDERVELSKF